ncbi:MAG: hypothetical protein JWR03_402 [Cohnella sp.]|nr:hypothetical protein [Cohnella sp.]
MDLPAGGQLAVGDTVKGKLSELKQLPVKWIHVGSEKEAQAGLDRQQYYGALVLPQDLSAGVVSIQGGLPKPATVKIYLNEGMNAQAGSAVKAILQQVSGTIGAELSGQLLKQIGQQTPQIPVTMVGALLHPFMTEEVTVHPVGTNNASGGAPNMLTQLFGWAVWCSVCLCISPRMLRRLG